MGENKIITEFDRQNIYEKEAEPLLKQLEVVLRANMIPFFFSACVKNSEEGSEYVHEGNLCGSNRIVLKDDKITDYVRVLCGFKIETQDEGYTINPPGEDIEITFENEEEENPEPVKKKTRKRKEEPEQASAE